MGDILLTFPLVSYFKHKYPQCKITFLAKSEYQELLYLNKEIDEVILFDKKIDTIASFRNKIRTNHFDYIFDLHNNPRSNLFCLFNGVKRSLFNKHSIRKWLLVKFKINLLKKYPHISTRYFLSLEKFRLLEKKDFKIFQTNYKIPVTEEEINEFHTKFPFLNNYDKIIGLCPTARHKTKMYPQDKIVQIGKKLISDNKTAVLILGSGNEFEYCEKIRIQISDNNYFNLAGKTSIRETSIALNECNLVITNDTGLMHLTALLNIPLIAIFGSTVKEFGFFPTGMNASVIENNNLKCRPCSHIGLPRCPKGHFKCMKDIDENLIIDKAERILKSL